MGNWSKIMQCDQDFSLGCEHAPKRYVAKHLLHSSPSPLLMKEGHSCSDLWRTQVGRQEDALQRRQHSFQTALPARWGSSKWEAWEDHRGRARMCGGWAPENRASEGRQSGLVLTIRSEQLSMGFVLASVTSPWRAQPCLLELPTLPALVCPSGVLRNQAYPLRMLEWL